MVGFLPERMHCSIARLSSKNLILGACGNIFFHKSRAGKPIVRKAWLLLTISDSGVDVDTQPCFLLTPVIGQQVLGPLITRYAPVVDFCVGTHPAKSASAYSAASREVNGSPIQPTWVAVTVESI